MALFANKTVPSAFAYITTRNTNIPELDSNTNYTIYLDNESI